MPSKLLTTEYKNATVFEKSFNACFLFCPLAVFPVHVNVARRGRSNKLNTTFFKSFCVFPVDEAKPGKLDNDESYKNTNDAYLNRQFRTY